MANNNIGKFSFTTSYTEEIVPKGTIYTTNGRKYVFAYNFGATSIAAGDAVMISTTFVYGNVSVTPATIMDVTDGTTIRPILGGIAGAACVTTSYLWLWYEGYGTHAITTDTNVAANDLLTATDGAIILTREVTAATAHRSPMGVAWAADSGSTLSSAHLKGDGIFPWGLGQ